MAFLIKGLAKISKLNENSKHVTCKAQMVWLISVNSFSSG